MKKLSVSQAILPQVQGNDEFFAQKARAKDFNGLMDPIIGFDHFELTRDVFGPHPHAGMSAISYVFEDSAPYRSVDSRGNDSIITPGSLLWTWAGKGVVHSEFPIPEGATVKGLQLFVNIAANRKRLEPQSVLIEKSQMPEIISEGVRVKVVSGATGSIVNDVQTPEMLTLLHVFLDPEKSFSHELPAHWSVTIYVLEGRPEVMTSHETIELEEGSVLCMGDADGNETLTFTGITNCELLFISGKPLRETLFSQGAMTMDSAEHLAQTLADYRSGKMGFIEMDGNQCKIIQPV